jgi:hypothetical protein
MTIRQLAGSAASAALAASLLFSGCTGGSETTAAEEDTPQKNAAVQPASAPQEGQVIQSIETVSPAIPIYAGARYREDLTRRDQVMVRNQFGPNAEVYTLASDDSYPQVFHYYLTYLAQFRAFPAQLPYPPDNKNWRTFEVQLNQAMQDSFVPGNAIPAGAKNVTLQIAETEAEPQTIIRYIVTPAGPPPTNTASLPVSPGAPTAR